MRMYFIEMRDDGTQAKLYDKYLLQSERTRKTVCEETTTSEAESSMGLPLQALAGIFILHALALAFAVVLQAFVNRYCPTSAAETSSAAEIASAAETTPAAET